MLKSMLLVVGYQVFTTVLLTLLYIVLLRPFSRPWWSWLTLTGLAVSGALSMKASGILTFLAVGLLATGDILTMALTRSANGVSLRLLSSLQIETQE